MVAWGEVHQIIGRQQGLRPKGFGQLSMHQHASNLLYDHLIHVLNNPIVLRDLGGSGLVPDALYMEEASELPHVLSLIVYPHGFQLQPSLPLDMGMKLLEPFKDLVLYADRTHSNLAGSIVNEGDEVPVPTR